MIILQYRIKEKSMGFFKKRILRPLITIAVIAAPIVLFAKGGFSFTFAASDVSYADVLRDGVENGSARVVDIAMWALTTPSAT
jgi:hypothetical protein